MLPMLRALLLPMPASAHSLPTVLLPTRGASANSTTNEHSQRHALPRTYASTCCNTLRADVFVCLPVTQTAAQYSPHSGLKRKPGMSIGFMVPNWTRLDVDGDGRCDPCKPLAWHVLASVLHAHRATTLGIKCSPTFSVRSTDTTSTSPTSNSHHGSRIQDPVGQ
jgi:hypothetical protein